MITVKDLMRRLSLTMAAAVLMPLAHAAPSSTGMASAGAVTEAADGMALYQAHCAACHDGQVPRAPHMITFSTIGAATILNAMNNGVMRAQAAALSATEREVLAGFLAGEAMAPPKPGVWWWWMNRTPTAVWLRRSRGWWWSVVSIPLMRRSSG